MFGQELGQVFLAGLKQDGQITAVQHMPTVLAVLLNQKAERWIQLGRTAGQIDRSSPGCAYEFEGQCGCPRGHDLGPFRTSVYMTVEACLVTQLAQVDLNGLQIDPFKRKALLLADPLGKGLKKLLNSVHARVSTPLANSIYSARSTPACLWPLDNRVPGCRVRLYGQPRSWTGRRSLRPFATAAHRAPERQRRRNQPLQTP